jgi:signal transduction histidine kinase/CheY-like chemotaxis protein
VTPILRNDRIVAILGVGNKESPYTDSDADAVAYLADVAWEIAERKRGDEERERLQTQLEQAMKLESIGRLAGGVAHDVNNMLMVMMGTCDLMESLTGSGGPIVAHIGRMRRAAERTSALTRQLLAFGRRQTVHLEPLDLNEVVSGTTEMLAQLIGEDIETAIVPCDGPATVKADRSQIEQSLTNLVVNARDAMPSGGRLTIETGFVSLDEEYARTHAYVQPGDYVTLSVTDTGIGIPDEVREHIFEPFFTTKAPGSGTGLGLASVYGAVKQCGGSMEVTSIVGVGTTFRILLPRCYERPTVRAGDRPSAPHGAGHRVLVVDDDAALRDVISALVASLGCKPTTVSDGAAAIRAVQQPGAPPDLVITDVVMPAMNGPELAARLRELVPGLKVLFMSGYTEYADGVIDSDVPLLAKPFTRADLAAAISKLLPLAPPAKGIAVIIVDDDRDVLDLVEMACGRRGHTVVGAQSAQAALRALASRPFDIAVVDNNVAGMDAARIIRMLREAGWRLPIIVYTGDAGSVDTKSLDPLGVVAVIEKSDRLDGLTDAIEAHAHPIPPADDRTG